MLASKKTKRGVVGAIVLAGVLAAGGYALTNTITWEETGTLAGFGQQNVQQLQVTDVDYTLTTGDPTTVDSVLFTTNTFVTGAGDAQAFVRPNNTAAWVACNSPIADGNSIQCDFATPVPIVDFGETGGGDPGATTGQAAAGTADGGLKLVVAE